MARYLILPLMLLLALAGLLFWVGNDPKVTIQALEYKPLELSLQIIILGLVGFVAAIIGLWSLMIWMWNLPRRMKTGFGRKRAGHGLDAIEQAMLASESGDNAGALKKAKRAHDLLGRPALTGIINAKTAEAAGETEQASTFYTDMLDDPKTELAGRRGLTRLSKDQGDITALTTMAKTAYDGGKGPRWAFDELLDAQITGADWDGALETLAQSEKRKILDRDQTRRTRAALLAAKASGLEHAGAIEDAVDTARRAAELSPGFAPASALAARLLSKNGQVKTAAYLLEKAWGQAPHPALAIAYLDLYAGESEKLRDKKVKTLIKANPNHRESSILLAQQALDKKDGVGTLQALGTLLRAEEPSARLCSLGGAAEELLGNDIDARAWQIRAASAPREADWSDLDPDGSDFNYTQKDWQRLVATYGKTGTLIHPRLEANKRRRAVIAAKDLPAPSVQSNAATSQTIRDTPPPNPDDPGVKIDDNSAQDLSQRLDNLLDPTDDTP